MTLPLDPAVAARCPEAPRRAGFPGPPTGTAPRPANSRDRLRRPGEARAPLPPSRPAPGGTVRPAGRRPSGACVEPSATSSACAIRVLPLGAPRTGEARLNARSVLSRKDSNTSSSQAQKLKMSVGRRLWTLDDGSVRHLDEVHQRRVDASERLERGEIVVGQAVHLHVDAGRRQGGSN